MCFHLKKKIIEISATEPAPAIIAIAMLLLQTTIVFNLYQTALHYAVMNCCIFVLIYSFLFIFTRKHTICYSVVSLIQLFFYYLDTYVYFSRGTHIQFNDVYCVRDALQVSKNYPLVMNWDIFRIFLFTIMINVLIYAFFMKREFRKFKEYRKERFSLHIVFSVISAAVIFVVSLMADTSRFDINSYTESLGLPAALIAEMKYSRVQKPKDYSYENTRQILTSYGTESGHDAEEVNIIVVMNESWTDYSLTGDVTLPKDPMPFYHSLEKNCAKGSVLTSVYGGYTCNTEFEFLTGATMGFLPQNSSPYLQYLHGKTDSVLKDSCFDGYSKVAIHPFYAEEWRRTTNYPYLGFDEFIAGENFSDNYIDVHGENITNEHLGENNTANFGDDLEYIRTFVSDKECYRKVLETLDRNTEQDRLSFIFAITIQNHGAYSYENFDSERYLDDENVNQFLTLTEISDAALKYLIDELSKREEKTVLLVFGDHQPGWDEKTKNVLRNAGMNSEDIYNYITPYLVWSNFNMEWEMPQITGANCLSLYLKQNLGLPLTEFDLLRRAVSEEYPAISANYFITANGEKKNISELPDTGVISDYKFVQYQMIFD